MGEAWFGWSNSLTHYQSCDMLFFGKGCTGKRKHLRERQLAGSSPSMGRDGNFLLDTNVTREGSKQDISGAGNPWRAGVKDQGEKSSYKGNYE